MRTTSFSMNRRQFLRGTAGLFSAATLVGLTACGSSSSSSSSSNSNNATSSNDNASGSLASFDGKFIVGFDQEFPPYGYQDDNGNYTGFDLELAQAVCEKEGWTYTPTPISWDAKDAMLNSGQITCIWNGFTIEGREDDYAFTDPYMENRQVIVVKAGSDIKSLSDLAGKNVITQADSAALSLLTGDGAQAELGASFNGGEPSTIDNYNTAFMMLESGSTDAIAIDYPVAVYNIGDRTSEFTILDESLNSEHFAVGFAKTDLGSALASQVEKDLQALDSEGKVEELCQKYSDQGVSYDLWVLPKA